MHPQIEEHLGDRHLDQGRQVHKHAKCDPYETAQQCILPASLDPFRPDEPADDAHHKDANDQQREDLLDELPGLPQKAADFFLGQAVFKHPTQQQDGDQDAQRFAGDQHPQSFGFSD